ncbi:hypothetical protein B0A49_11369, partial [Cryomyces minteri]
MGTKALVHAATLNTKPSPASSSTTLNCFLRISDSTIMAVCPSNSTECLLRALFNAQDVYNWNPLTFGATVAIGVLALVVAATTVFQGALTAGPGRLKASKNAIGEYSETRRTKLSWTELRFRTTVNVPFIGGLEHQFLYRLHGTAGNAIVRDTPDAKTTLYPAGWLNLLRATRLPPLEPRSQVSMWDWSSIVCQTDYLPSDVQAAPAYATIHALVQLAALAGCHTVVQQPDGFPVASGNGAQLTFRNHPSLGRVGVFEHYPVQEKVFQTMATMNDLDSTLANPTSQPVSSVVNSQSGQFSAYTAFG